MDLRSLERRLKQTMTALTVMTFMLYLSTAFNSYSTDVGLTTRRVIVKNVPDLTLSRNKLDLGVVTFDIDANFTDLFNWNVKEIFVYLVAEYNTTDQRLNQVVLWDKIISRGEPATVHVTDIHSKYDFWDDGKGLRRTPVRLSLRWNVIPNAGLLDTFGGNAEHEFVFPDKYHNSVPAG